MIPIITQPHRSLHRKKSDGLKKLTNIEDQNTYTDMRVHKQEAELEQNILRSVKEMQYIHKIQVLCFNQSDKCIMDWKPNSILIITR